SDDGTHAVTATEDRTKLWDLQRGTQLHSFEKPDAVQSAEFSQDGSRVLTASYDGTARIWDTLSGRELLAVKDTAGILFHSSFTPNGKKTVTAGTSRIAKVWDAQTGRLLASLIGHRGWLWSARFSPNGEKIVTASEDRTARVWNAGSGQSELILDH